MNGKAMGFLVAATLLHATAAGAQRPEGDGPPFQRGPDVEQIMKLQEELGLTEEQLEALDEIRAEGVAQRTAAMAAAAEMRSRFEAGQIQRSDMMAFRESRMESRDAIRAAHEARLAEILTEAQLQQVQEMRLERAYRQGRASARGGRGGGPDHGWQREGRQGPRSGMQRQRRPRRPGG